MYSLQEALQRCLREDQSQCNHLGEQEGMHHHLLTVVLSATQQQDRRRLARKMELIPSQTMTDLVLDTAPRRSPEDLEVERLTSILPLQREPRAQGMAVSPGAVLLIPA